MSFLKNNLIFFVVYIFIYFLINQVNADDDILVTIRDGTVKGQKLSTFSNKSYYSFQKIPYATPPLGNLRFKAPLSPEKWNGILDASGYLDVVCYQIPGNSDFESEDCLYINVYTPQLPDDTNAASLPTLLYIYGGAFIEGGSRFEGLGPQFLIDEDVIVITFNYRLGPFGFLSTADEIIPGNAALQDQLLAIKWAHENLQYFGGDVDKITIVGESAGAASVVYQILNTKSEGLFRGAIIESSSALSPWAMQRYPRDAAFRTAAQINETFDEIQDSRLLLEFLQGVTAKELDDAGTKVNSWSLSTNRSAYISRVYSPVIEVEHDGAFLTEKMYGKIKTGDFVQVPLLAGFNSLESIGSASSIDGFTATMQAYDTNLDWLVPQDMLIEDAEERKKVGEKIRNIYTSGGYLVDNLLGGVEFISDNRCTRSVRKTAEMYSKYASVYFYQFSYDGAIGGNDVSVNGVKGVAHAEDVRYLWHSGSGSSDNGNFDNYPEADVLTLKRMCRFWANFVKHLNPTPAADDLLQGVTWPPVSSGHDDDFLYLDIDVDLSIENKPKDATYQAWNEIYESLGHEDFDTY